LKDITIGFQIIAHYGDMPRMREAWIEAEELGVDRIYTSDHLNAVPIDVDLVFSPNDGSHNKTVKMNVFEATTIQAAMAATTSRVEIGCIVHSNSYRNPNMLAYIANTIEHISGGRFLLGIGSGYVKEDYDAFGYEYGTQKSRSLALERDIPIIIDRFSKLTPKPLHHIPLMIASMGEKIGLRTVAKYADIWHVYGPYQTMVEKAESLKRICKEEGRDINNIEFATYYWPHLMKGSDDTLDNYLKMGVKHVIVIAEGPNWDLGLLKEILAWRNAKAANVALV
jgi:alkanesulfonate monooxygenase SsuD/methylene tetrahydromethanopterin reductase-like flavin-dependent oxidoreductase (luciferase family)